MTTPAPVTFEEAGPRRQVAKLGDVVAGELVDGLAGRFPAAWRSYLPDTDKRTRIVPATSIEAAQDAFSEHVWTWLQRAGATLTRSAPAPAEERKRA